MAAFNCRKVDDTDPSALQGEAAVQEQAIKAIAASPNWLDALKNLVFFFVANGRGFEGLGPDAAKVDELLSAHGLYMPEPWLKNLIVTASQEMEHRHHPFRCVARFLLLSSDTHDDRRSACIPCGHMIVAKKKSGFAAKSCTATTMTAR